VRPRIVRMVRLVALTAVEVVFAEHWRSCAGQEMGNW